MNKTDETTVGLFTGKINNKICLMKNRHCFDNQQIPKIKQVEEKMTIETLEINQLKEINYGHIEQKALVGFKLQLGISYISLYYIRAVFILLFYSLISFCLLIIRFVH